MISIERLRELRGVPTLSELEPGAPLPPAVCGLSGEEERALLDEVLAARADRALAGVGNVLDEVFGKGNVRTALREVMREQPAELEALRGEIDKREREIAKLMSERDAFISAANDLAGTENFAWTAALSRAQGRLERTETALKAALASRATST